MNFTVYNKKTGKVFDIIEDAPQGYIPIVEEGYGYVKGLADPHKQYVKDGAIVDRPAVNYTCSSTTITANGVSTVTIGNLPNGFHPCYIKIPDGDIQEIEIDDGILVMTTDYPGEYKVRIDPFPYQPIEVIINAI